MSSVAKSGGACSVVCFVGRNARGWGLSVSSVDVVEVVSEGVGVYDVHVYDSVFHVEGMDGVVGVSIV